MTTLFDQDDCGDSEVDLTEVRLAIVGSRDWTWSGAQRARYEIEKAIQKHKPARIISGGAPGVDTWAREAAVDHGIPILEFLPEEERWAPNGYRERNGRIVRACTHLVAIQSSRSATYGTGYTAELAEDVGKLARRVLIQCDVQEPISRG